MNTYVRDNTSHLQGALGAPVAFSRNSINASLNGAVLSSGEALNSVTGVPIPFNFEVTGLAVTLNVPREAGTITVSFRHYATSMTSHVTLDSLSIDGANTQFNSSTTPSGTITGPRVLLPVVTTDADLEPEGADIVVTYWVTRA
jgi:hypothetical protein